MAEEVVTMTARCLCKKHVFTTTVKKASLPLMASVCHCDSCRHLLGGLCFADVPWPNEKEDLSGLKRYEFSKNTVILSCAVCSTQIFCQAKHADDVPCVITGALDNTPGLVTYDYHMFVGDTKDGGASTWLLKTPEGSPILRWKGRRGVSEQLPISWPNDSVSAGASKEKAAAASPDMTPLRCCCRGVSLMLQSGRDLASGTSKKGMSQPPRPGTGKYCSSIDACDSCRLATGTDHLYWAFVPVDHLCSPNESSSPSLGLSTIDDLREAVDAKDARLGTLSRYRSSPTVDRYHCGSCSATIFYTQHDLPGQVDIAIGVLEHPDGARAEGLLEWKMSDIDHQQDTVGGWRADLTEGLLEGCRASVRLNQ